MYKIMKIRQIGELQSTTFGLADYKLDVQRQLELIVQHSRFENAAAS